VLITFTGSSVSRRSGRLGVHGVFTLKLSPLLNPFSLFFSFYFYAFICFFFFCAISLPVSVLCGGIIWNFLGDPFWWYQLNSVLNFLFCHGHYSFSSLFRQVLSSHLVSIWLMFQTRIRAFAAYCNNPRSSSGDDPTQANSHYLYALPRGPNDIKMEGWAYHVLGISIIGYSSVCQGEKAKKDLFLSYHTRKSWTLVWYSCRY